VGLTDQYTELYGANGVIRASLIMCSLYHHSLLLSSSSSSWMKGLILSVNVRCLHVSVTSPGGGIYNPAHPKPFHISKDVNGHIRPTPVIMKKGYGCVLCKNGLDSFGYKDVLVLRQFLTPSGHLMNRRQTGYILYNDSIVCYNSVHVCVCVC
jgi:ribosomal protein S18